MSLNIHVNSSTKITLNDRFTLMQNMPSAIAVKRVQSPRQNRHNSSQIGGGAREQTPKGSYRNRQLIDQLEKRHKIVAAMKLKKKSIHTNLTFRQKNKINWKNAGKAISISPGGKLRRTNSLTNLATMKADMFTVSGPATGLRRSNSASNLAGRLGNRRGRGRINRSNSFSNLKQSNSKQNLTRSNSRTNLSRTNSQTNLNRSNSKTRYFNLNANPERRKLNRSNFRQRSNSVNSRLGLNRTNVPNMVIGGKRGRGRIVSGGGSNIVRGRIFRRSTTSTNVNGTGQQGRLGRPRIRGVVRGQTRFRGGQSRGRTSTRGQSVNRGRSRSRSRSQANLIVKNSSSARQQGTNTRGRGTGRGRGTRGRGARGGGGVVGTGGRTLPQPVKSKEELDQELEQYMANTKSHLDKEMDEYMKDVTY